LFPESRISQGMPRFITVFAFFLSFLLKSASAQNVQLSLGPSEIGENQAWTITITVNNESLKSYDNFPDIDGFKKRGTSTQSQTSIVNGSVSSTQSVIMTYSPLQQGTFTVPAFKMKVNGVALSSQGKKVKVGPTVQAQYSDPFGRPSGFGRGDTEFVDIKEDALLALTTTKNEVYVGEGFTTTLSFLVADNNRAPMQFYELGKQLSEILKKLKPASCWEENFNIENIEAESIQIEGKGYSQYKIYQATYYPLNAQTIVLPSVSLEMIKYRVAKNPSFFGQNRQEDFKTFSSQRKTIKVKQLPPHPLKDQVAVGDYRLEEKIASSLVNTGQSIGYEFNVYGEGNISSIEKPIVKKDSIFDFYEPNVKQSINRNNGRVTGLKSFSYFMIPKEPGEYKLSDFFNWVFFNPRTAKYDTLHSKQIITVNGESQQYQTIESGDGGSFYDRIETADSTLHSSSENTWMDFSVNIFILLILGASAYLMFKK
jgi:hypothetical protein